ncbi:bifunctional pyr operon transcriptional regulator/uracil phosphoribosyltransferase PyrR [bacterium]|nr:bifunctional pyr operon transcriptional regulator/uracil phosphoribosyltransferase PyrR [bacterium]MBU1153666.1 bifunctional pyr operon transcriptional regulator/uracil phosphoribosyltransferase PyrR [bacterium]MBU1782239.1 bifunctional pyr operon transcriptional regulator/uracil phosphoribosyltransferase PyrR [bacterium]
MWTDKIKAVIMDEIEIKRTISRLSHEILEKNSKDIDKLALIGIRKKGVPLAYRLQKKINEIEKVEIPVGIIDITLYRDDINNLKTPHVVHETEIFLDVNDKKIILVDDVLYTGRTVRCAIDELIDFGRPKAIQLVVLIDRGHREIPIKADFIGKNLPTSYQEIVKVYLSEVDEMDKVVIYERENNHAQE